MRAFFLTYPCRSLPAAKTLDVYFVDVEAAGDPDCVSFGQSMMVDTGWPGFNNRDADRIAAAAKTGGREAGGLPGDHAFPHRSRGRRPATGGEAADQALRHHGENRESGANPDALYSAYKTAMAARASTSW